MTNIKIKREKAHLNGLTLIIVPCWWTGDVDSLKSTIQFQRPDLYAGFCDSFSPPITLNSTLNVFSDKTIPNIGELMIASFPRLDFNDLLHYNAWWIGEKYDGVRYCWSPKSEGLYSRHGNLLPLPLTLSTLLPSTPLDGEIWFGRGGYNYTYLFLKESPTFFMHVLRMIAFDSPIRNDQLSYEQRFEELLRSISPSHPFSIVATRVGYKDKRHMDAYARDIIENSGEGVILQMQSSPYLHGRSDALIKIKSTAQDKEGMVVGMDAENVILKLPCGRSIEVPKQSVTPSHLLTQIKKGDIVSFSYEHNARRDSYLHPKIYRIRLDLDWDQVVLSSSQENHFLDLKEKNFRVMPAGYWRESKGKNRAREFLIQWAIRLGYDPFIASSWFFLTSDDLAKEKHGNTILQNFKGGYYSGLRTIFPDIGTPKSEIQRQFFEDYAKIRNFESSDCDYWYFQSRDSILQMEGGYDVLFHFGFSVSKAIQTLFPDIGFDKKKYGRSHFWIDYQTRRKYFENYAKQCSFDHLVAENWYKQTKESLCNLKGIRGVLSFHNNRVSKALVELFPEVGLNKKLFSWKTQKKVVHIHIRDASKLQERHESRNTPIQKRQQFFYNYAQENAFNPLIPDNWYSVSKEKFLSSKGAWKIMWMYENTISNALVEVFPNIGIEKNKFQNWS